MKVYFPCSEGRVYSDTKYNQVIYWPFNYNCTVISEDKGFVFSGRQTDLVVVNRQQGALKPITVHYSKQKRPLAGHSHSANCAYWPQTPLKELGWCSEF